MNFRSLFDGSPVPVRDEIEIKITMKSLTKQNKQDACCDCKTLREVRPET